MTAQSKKTKKAPDTPSTLHATGAGDTLKIVRGRDLGLDVKQVPRTILKIIDALNNAGFDAYIVGGGVRDGLLGCIPKDFDIATNARPHEVKDVFGRSARIIGRRFQLAHVHKGGQIIEVATFRAPPKDDNHTNAKGMIVNDNVWGTIEEDFARRDFSVNALYYHPQKDVVLDFCGALDDIYTHRLRLLGSARQRIKEDPVRLLRALRFGAKLGFGFDHDLSAQFTKQNWKLLRAVSPHRLYDETQKMFMGGYLAKLLPMLYQYGAAEFLFANSSKMSAFALAVAQNTDVRINAGNTANAAFFYAVLLWESYLRALAKYKKHGKNLGDAQASAVQTVLNNQQAYTAIPRFAEQFISDIWCLQTRLQRKPKPKAVQEIVKHPRFRAAYDFLSLAEAHCDCPLYEHSDMTGFWQSYAQNITHKDSEQDDISHTPHQLSFAPKTTPKRSKVAHQDEWAQIQSLCASSSPSASDGTPAPSSLFGASAQNIDTLSHTKTASLAINKIDTVALPRTRSRRAPSSDISLHETKQSTILKQSAAFKQSVAQEKFS